MEYLWSDLKNNFTDEFSKCFYVGHRMDEMSFWNPKLFGVPHLGFLTSVGLIPPKGTPSEGTFSTGTIDLQ